MTGLSPRQAGWQRFGPVTQGLRMPRVSLRPRFITAAVAMLGLACWALAASADAAIDGGMARVAGNPIARVPLDHLSATRNRPLFSPSRRPPAPPDHRVRARHVDQAPPPVPAPPGIALFGIVIGAQGARAFIATKPAERIIGVRPGDDVSGWTVTAITQRRLVLSRADRSATFTLFSAANASQTRQSEAAASGNQATRTASPPHRRVRIR